MQTVVLTKTGEVVGNSSTVLRPGQRISQLIDQLVPEAQGQSGGLIFLKSDVPVYASSLFGSNDGQVLANIPPQLAPEGYDPGVPPLEITPALAVVQPDQTQSFQVVGDDENAVWNVNGFEGGTATQGAIATDGTYTAPSQVPLPRVVTVSAEVDNQTAAASVDILEKETLLTSLSIVQSVVYLGSLQQLYTAELTVLGSSGEGPQPTDQRPAQDSFDSEIFAVAPGPVKTSLADFSGEEISKMIAYTSSNGQEFLLLAAKTSGKVIRLDPTTQQNTEVATGLNQPESVVIDPFTGNLLVAEQDQITTVTKADLEAGLVQAARLPGGPPKDQAAELFSATGTSGIAVDRCTGNVYLSNQTTGEILRFIRSSEELQVVFSGLQQPTRLLAFYREKVSCPDSFHLLVIEQGTDQILLTLPVRDAVTPWIPARESRDLAFLPGGSPFATDAAVLFTETVEEQQAEQGTVSSVNTPDLYDEEPDNPPQGVTCVGTVTLADANLAAAVREALGIDQAADITCEQAQGLLELGAPFRQIADLSGLEFFTNLTSLNLIGNSISDISPLAGLTQLMDLNLVGAPISDISPLAGLTRLIDLDLSETHVISDIAPLAGLTQLIFLNLNDNRINDISPLAGLTRLTSLSLVENSFFRDIDIVPLAGLTQLTFLNLSFNSIGDLGPLAGLTQLIDLDLAGANISDLSPLAGLTQLTFLDLSRNSISDLTPLAGLIQLNRLILVNNLISDISPLVANTGLGAGDLITLSFNPLDTGDCANIQTLIDRGTSVSHNLACP